MALPVLKTERLYRQIANAIVESIQRGEFAPGAALPPERELAKQLGVSRSSVREALIALEMTGWVDIRTGNGVFAMQPLPSASTPAAEADYSLEDLLQARLAFEGMLAEMAARNGSPAQREQLRLLADTLLRYRANDAEFLEQDKGFHLLIGEMSGNEVLREMMEFLWNKRDSARFRRLERHFADNAFTDEMNRDHQQIAAAICAGDAAAARAAMESHLAQVKQRLLG
ncbi:MAG: FadR/GntR family transcriptional regulator [Pantoea sp.]|uniref:GntR family transcriptional regulator n=1 Tax=Pantoea septica TaxID=472695 RepID=A0ABX3UX50_9GAMM|nr:MULTISPECIES: FadR/GntR family transcriptional regulator [Pantoea]MBU5378373.1 FadR family transcriptional regulator [Pantoea septica]MDU5781374.1 FadR/GntR family transcriptional regulator [Pantoea sp.]MDU5835646.1 FadR/GntR family transcriptional regulator [Pantoea sp.]MDU6438560.1 FadR/GntR family transcriptional regulator [Pantoea sp.]ORN02275.1 GntR family transcriptional regulator [Pantoea septica]